MNLVCLKCHESPKQGDFVAYLEFECSNCGFYGKAVEIPATKEVETKEVLRG